MDIINALLTGFILSFMIGPVFFVLLETSATRGIKHAIVFDLGVILADIIFIIIAYYGSFTALTKIKDDPNFFFIGGFVLFVYGLITFIKEKRRKIITDPKLVIIEKTNFFGLFLKGFLLNFINVGVLAFWLALVILVSKKYNMNTNYVFWYFAVAIAGYFITDLGKIILAKQLKDKMTPFVIRRIRKIMGIVLMFIGVIIASKEFIPEKTKEKIKEKTEQVIDRVKQ